MPDIHIPNFIKYIIVLLFGFTIGVLLVNYGFQSSLKKTNIQIGYGHLNLNLNLEADKIDHEIFLEKLFSKNFSKSGTLSWLRQKHQVYDLNDFELTIALKDLDLSHRLSQEIRKMQELRQGPFQYKIDTIYAGFPGNVTSQGVAFVPFKSPYRGHIIELSNPVLQRKIELRCEARYHCTGAIKCPDIQLNNDDGLKLFNNGKLQKYEAVLATVLN